MKRELKENYEVIHVPNRLAERTTPTGGLSLAEIEAQAYIDLQTLSAEFPSVARSHLEKIESAIGVARQSQKCDAVVPGLQRDALALRDQSACCGYPVIEQIGASLYQGLEESWRDIAEFTDFVAAHLACMRWALDNKVTDAGDPKAAAALDALKQALATHSSDTES